jgi:hypothetical protein
MMAIYLMIALSPLSTLAMQSKKVAHAVTGECSGDCEICGCSAESRANHTCCCCRKKRQQCDKPNIADKGCAMKVTSAPEEPRVDTSDICAVKNHYHQDKTDQHLSNEGITPKTQTVFKCNCPCGKNKVLALWGGFNHEIIPYWFPGGILPPMETRSFPDYSRSLTSRHDDPPDPPPKLHTLT